MLVFNAEHIMTTGFKMLNTILINAIDYERSELRVAVLKNGILENLIIENETTKITKGNIYLGTITSDVPSLEAYFVAFGSDKHGFLPYKELPLSQGETQPKKMKVGHNLLVQIDKEERGTKGAALTAQISIAGQYLVAMPHSPESLGISKNIAMEQRDAIRKTLGDLQKPEEMGLILRTAGQNRSIDELQNDLDGLIYLWEQIQSSAKKAKAPALVFQEYQGIFKILRETVNAETQQIILDNEQLVPTIKDFLKQIMPSLLDAVTLHSSQVPIFTHHQIEDFIESLYSREVQLKSGGKLFIDKTEALYAIDVNSAQATGASTIENTAFETNVEAVEHIAQLLKLRDINGIIIIDLIDMTDDKHKARVLEVFHTQLKNDPSKVQVSEISKLGLLEVSRQRTRPSLAESHLITCPQCHGRGFVRSTESFSYSLLHIIEQHAIHGKTSHILVQVPVEVASYLCNEKRGTLTAIESRQGVAINIIGNPHYMVPKYQIKRIRATDATFGDPSYSHIQEPSTDLDQSHYAKDSNKQKPKQKAMVTFDDKKAAPTRRKKSTLTKGGLFAKILKALTGQSDDKPSGQQKKQSGRSQKRQGTQDGRRGRQGGQRQNQRKQGQRRHNNRQKSGPNNRRGPNATNPKSQNPNRTGGNKEQPNQSANSKNAGPKQQRQPAAKATGSTNSNPSPQGNVAPTQVPSKSTTPPPKKQEIKVHQQQNDTTKSKKSDQSVTE